MTILKRSRPEGNFEAKIFGGKRTGASMERAVLAVDVNHALAKLSDAVVAWHNEQSGDEVPLRSISRSFGPRMSENRAKTTVACVF